MKFSSNKPKVYFKTFGCRTNIFDTQVMINNLKDFDMVSDEAQADLVVINSCTVTNSADSSAKNYVNSLKKLSNSPKIFFTGCGVWTKGEGLFNEGKIDSLFGHSLKEEINEILKKQERIFEPGNLEHIDKTIVSEFVGKSRAFIKIQEGCDFRCSYCIIPYVRGDARSYDMSVILEQISTLAQNGFGEFILTGTNIGSYGKKDKNTSLAKLLKEIFNIKGVRRVRLGSVEPVQIDDEFKELLNEPKMAKHLHIALQHTSKDMLRIMNRRNKVLDDLALFEYIADRGYAIGTDFIVGHPGETDSLWSEAMQNLHRFPLTHIHAFTYSKRDGTPSAVMKEIVKGDIAKARHAELTKCINEKNRIFRENNYTNLEVLIESTKNKNSYKGYDQFYNLLEVKSKMDLSNSWVIAQNAEVRNDKNFFEYEC